MFYERLKALGKEKGVSLTNVLKELGMSTGNLSRWKRGIVPKSDTISALAEYFGVTSDYLLGIDSIKEKPSNVLESQSLTLTAKETQIVLKYRGLDDEGRTMVDSAIIAETRRVEASKEKTADAGTARTAANQATTPERPKKPLTALPRVKRRSDGFSEYQVYEQGAAAGLGNYLDTPSYHMEQYPSEIVPEKTDFGIIISGDSMEPEIHNGATAFVQSCSTLEAGEIGIFVLGGKAYCKMLFVDHAKRQVRLVSVNKAYDDIIVGENDDLYTLGRVLGQYVPRV